MIKSRGGGPHLFLVAEVISLRDVCKGGGEACYRTLGAFDMQYANYAQGTQTTNVYCGKHIRLLAKQQQQNKDVWSGQSSLLGGPKTSTSNTWSRSFQGCPAFPVTVWLACDTKGHRTRSAQMCPLLRCKLEKAQW